MPIKGKRGPSPGPKRGTRTSAILGELTGQLAVNGALLDADDWTCGLPDGAGILDVRTGETRPSTADACPHPTL